ncbi:molybdate-binding periplasmic protein precursor [bacterium BMS3Bbin10]|nr:molybdate-binding periplasmic protein precursor [bacterium BMS3Bbin10]HDL16424.1 molybdate ABC transporter substrate-binding protein [Hyphomicrobiales bacterium]
MVSTSALGVLSLAGAGRAAAVMAGTSPIIAAAASLRFALQDAAGAFRSETGLPLRLNFGSSGNLARQIRQGAPFELFLSADEEYALSLARDGFTAGEGVRYALGQLVIFAPGESPVRVDPELSGLREALARGDIKRFAIANPDHAPYGRAAREALIHAGLWEALEPKLVFGENISQAAQFTVSGSCEGGMISRSLAVAPRFAGRGRFVTISAELHRPLRQRMVLMTGAGNSARAFFDYLQGPAARKIFDAGGFAQPGPRRKSGAE